jgi:hypothetical protein
MELLIDPARHDALHGITGIYVRAKDPDGRWGSFDIAELDRPSLDVWLRSRGGENEWAESVVAILLGHGDEES